MIASCPGFNSDNFIFGNRRKARVTELHFLTNFEIMPSDARSKVHFFFDAAAPTIRNRKALKTFISSIFKSERKELESINYVFSNDRSVQLINRRYLNHKALTDIITFELSERNGPIIGEVYISIDRVRENALTYGTSFRHELHRVLFHGALHLCGFGDKTVPEMKEMRKKEEYYLTKYFL
jgi:probable rRNA maturation factor